MNKQQKKELIYFITHELKKSNSAEHLNLIYSLISKLNAHETEKACE